MNYLAKNIRYLRKKYDYKQDQLALMLNKKSFTTIQKWETEETIPPFNDIISLTEIFNVNLDDFAKTDLSVTKADETTVQEAELLTFFRQLNDIGKERAITSIIEMTFNPIFNHNYLAVLSNYKKSTDEITEEIELPPRYDFDYFTKEELEEINNFIHYIDSKKAK